MKTFLFVSLILLFSVCISYAQPALKLGASYQLTSTNFRSTQRFVVDMPSYYKFRSPNRYLEAGFSSFNVGVDNSTGADYGYLSTTIDVSPFMEWGRIIGDSEKKWQFTVGGRLIWGNVYSKRKPGTSTDFTYTTFVTGATFAVVPGVLYKVGERLWLDARVPFQLITLSTHFRKTHSPMIPVSEQRNDGLEGELLPQNYRIGFGLIYSLRN